MDFVRQIAAAGAVLVLLAVTLWFLRRTGVAGLRPSGRRSSKRLESLERLTLGPQFTLHLVRLDETALLLAATPAGCTVVQNVTPAGRSSAPELSR